MKNLNEKSLQKIISHGNRSSKRVNSTGNVKKTIGSPKKNSGYDEKQPVTSNKQNQK